MKTAKVTKPKPDIESNIYKDYFQYKTEYQAKYGAKTVVLIQVGAFFEVYSLKSNLQDIENFAEVCQLNVTEKKDQYNGDKIVMAGFRDFTIDKYIIRLTDAGYTVPVFTQQKDGKDIHRKLTDIHSPGTYISCETDTSPKMTNNIMCIWFMIHKSRTLSNVRDTLIYGVSAVNIFTGKTSMFQYETAFYMNSATFDELERYVSIYSPNEIIVISPFDSDICDQVLQFSGIRSQTIHKIDTRLSTNIKVERCSNQKYIQEILSQFFGEESYHICNEFYTNIIATQSFCFLLNFIQEHNGDLVRKISIPEFNNTSYRTILANHTLSQLNIICDNNGDSGKYSSVLHFLNKCCSSMGKRKFQNQLMNPTFDEEWLSREYTMTGLIVENHEHFIDLFRKQLVKIRDIEKICRQLLLKKLYPSSLYQTYQSIEAIQQMNQCVAEVTELCDYLCDDISIPEHVTANSYIDNLCKNTMSFLNTHLIIESCKTENSLTNFDSNIIQKGISTELDDVLEKYNEADRKFHSIKNFLNTLMQKYEKNQDTDYIKIHETEKSGVSLQITAKRSIVLKTILENQTFVEDGNIITFKNVKFPKTSAANVDIDFPELKTICHNLLLLKERTNFFIAETYLRILDNFEKNSYDNLIHLAEYVAKVDVLQNKAYVAIQYKYCSPIIDSSAGQSFVETKDLRHCLIEHIQQNEIYVTNDLALGEESVLLFGTNAVGKTSLIRSLGIAVIMAQAGMFVPCSHFRYKPYTAIFTRILGNDNLFKGLSTFAVEMTELRTILKMADENSLILGDELCSGTETESALSIFVAGLMNLYNKRSSFVFATHFHEIVDYEEIRNLEKLRMKHMYVVYDREQECLIYDRKLRDGSGPKTYGLEVCKSLYLDAAFLEQAYQIRNKYFPETAGLLSNKLTKYNANKIRGICEQCGKSPGEEIHHLAQQKDADPNGFINTFHKNHKANLMSICEDCHDKIHESGSQVKRTKTTNGYVFI